MNWTARKLPFVYTRFQPLCTDLNYAQEKWLGLFEQLSPNDKWSSGGSQQCRVVHGGGRRLRRTGRRGGQLGAHQQMSFYAAFAGFGRLAQ